MPDLPTQPEPDYMTWDIEKLRNEYFTLNLKYLSLSITQAESLQAEEELRELANLLNRILERSHG